MEEGQPSGRVDLVDEPAGLVVVAGLPDLLRDAAADLHRMTVRAVDVAPTADHPLDDGGMVPDVAHEFPEVLPGRFPVARVDPHRDVEQEALLVGHFE